MALIIAAGAFFYSEFIHGYFMWALGWFFTLLLYALGVLLFGPQNYFLVKAYAKNVKVQTALIFGGVSQHKQVAQIRKGADVLVATPGRLLDLCTEDGSSCRTAVTRAEVIRILLSVSEHRWPGTAPLPSSDLLALGSSGNPGNFEE